MSETTQLRAYNLGRDWTLADGVLQTAHLREIFPDMGSREFETHWVQVERGVQGKPFEEIRERKEQREAAGRP